MSLIDAQVKQKNFLIKGAYSTIKAIKKGLVTETVDTMLDEWLEQIQPHFEEVGGDQAELAPRLHGRAQQ